MKRTTESGVLAFVLLAALATRVLFFVEAMHKPDFRFPMIDADYHNYWARGLASGQFPTPLGRTDPHINDRPFLRPPGYPYALAMAYRVTGPGYAGPRLIQMLLGVLNCFLIYLLARKWFGGPVGLVAAGLASLYWVYVYYEMEFLEPVIEVPLAVLLIYVLSLATERIRWGLVFAAGLFLGAFALVRPNVLLFGLAAMGWLCWIGKRRQALRRFVMACGVFGLGAAAAIAPATIRNYRVGHDFVLISANAGVNLFIGNNPSADGAFTDANLADIPFQSCFDYPAVVDDVSRKLGRPLRYSEASAYFGRQALHFAREQPGRCLALALKKAVLFWCPLEMGHNKEEHYERLASPVLRALPVSFAFVFAFSILGLALVVADAKRAAHPPTDTGQHRIEAVVLMVLFVATYYVSFIPFFIAGQYRVPVIPFLQILASFGICRIVQQGMNREWRPLALSASAGALLLVLTSHNFTAYRPSLSKWHFDRALTYGKSGQPELAIRGFEEALKCRPDWAEAHYNLGLALAAQGRADESLKHFQEAVAIQPDYAEALFNLGVAYSQRNQLNDAATHFEQATRANPAFAEAYWYAGRTQARLGNTDDAVRHFRKAVQLRPGLAPAWSDLAEADLRLGNSTEAVSCCQAALRVRPDDPAMLNLLAWIRATDADPAVRNGDEARALAEKACQLAPAGSPALLDTLAAAYAESGDFSLARATAEKALHLAEKTGDTNLIGDVSRHISLYEKQQPCRAKIGDL